MTQHEFEAVFSALGIPFTEPGFYDSPQFLTAERKDPKFLELYAQYVDVRKYDSEYLERSRVTVTRLAKFVYQMLQEDGRLGACIDVSGLMTRMLEKEGIWSYAVGGGLNIQFPVGSGLTSSHFGAIGGASQVAAHMWVRVPPFMVLDLTLPAQPWDSRRKTYVDQPILSERSAPCAVTVEQLLDMDAIGDFTLAMGREPRIDEVLLQFPHLAFFLKKFPAFSINSGALTVDYAPTKIGATEEPLEEMKMPILKDLTPSELYRSFKKNGDALPHQSVVVN